MDGIAKTTPQTAPAAPNKTRAGRWSLRMPFRVGQRFCARVRRTRHATKIRSFCGRRSRRKAPSRMEVTLGGALPPARGDLDDLVTSLVHEGARWAAPRTARRAVFGLGVARRATWFRHAAPIVTRGRHAFTEARKSTRIVAGAAATIRGRDHPVAREWDATLVDSVRRLVRPHAPVVSRRCASFASRRVRVGPLAAVRQCVC